VVGKGSDPSNLGRWTWSRYRGRNNHTLRIICGYRPNPPSGGPFTVYAQHKLYFNSTNDHRCPRAAFITDLCEEIRNFKSEGDHIILLLDGNADMRKGELASSLLECELREVILDKYGLNAPSTYRRNNTRTPIDGIWASPNINIEGGGYFLFDEVFQDTDHKCLWIDVTHVTAFGHNMPAIVRPSARRLHCRDPRIVNNYLKQYEKFVTKHQLLDQVRDLEAKSTFPLTPSMQTEYETLADLRCQGVRLAERKCRKFRMGQVSFSPEIHLARTTIYAWSMIKKKAKGLRVSSRLITRTLKKACLPYNLHLEAAYKHYYSIKGSHKELRKTATEKRAEALAAEGKLDKVKVLKEIRERENQRSTARKIRYLRGKISTGSTTIVTINDVHGNKVDLTNKEDIEERL
jgi:hypothetical protein